MTTRRAIAVVLLVALIGAAVAVWSSRERRPTLVLASSFVKTGTAAVRVDRFELAWEVTRGMSPLPPVWMMRYPLLVNGWARIFQKRERVYDGLVWVLVDATVTADQPLQSNDMNYRLDYGSYTLGSNGRSFRNEEGRPYAVSTRFEVTDGPLPKALEIQVRGEWIRFPIDVR